MLQEKPYREAEARLWRFADARPSETRVRLPRIGTEVRVQRVGSGPPVLFIHRGPNAGSTWALMVGRLPGFECLLVDRPGTGLSDPLPAVPTAQALPALGDRFVGDVLDGLGIERADLVASSLGGYLGLRSAAAEPARIGRMVQMACPAFVPGMKTPMFMRLMSLSAVRWLMGVLPPSPKVARDLLRQIGHGASLDADRIPDVFIDWYVDLQRHTDTMLHDGDAIGNFISLSGMRREVGLSEDFLRSVRTPTFFLWGADDTFGGEEVARAVAGLMPDAKLELVPGAGHLPWIDDPERAARVTQEFLRPAA